MIPHEKKTDPTLASNAWLEIDKAAFEGNIRTFQHLLGAHTKICAVMKADAYGHGISLLLPSVIAAGIPYVAVGSNDEARIVRENGYAGHLMRVRIATLHEIEDGFQYDMEEIIGSLEFASRVSAIAQRHGRTLRFHLGINSAGVNRNDLEMKTAHGRAEALALLQVPHLTLVGIMSHFPMEDRADVTRCLVMFNQETDWLIAHGKLDRSQILLHCANSAAALLVPESRLDMVRSGGALYGDTVPSFAEYQPMMIFKSRVASINHYPAGSTVGYERTFTLKRDSLLANLPVGYSNGYRRVFSNKADILIRGQRAPVVGKVSMNTLMVDVTDLSGVSIGDEAVLFGKQGDGQITQAELEGHNGAILSDLATVWGTANPKFLKAE